MLHRLVAPATVLALSCATLASCSTGSTKEAPDTPDAKSSVDADAFPVTIEHAHGETTIDDEPKRVVTIGWAEHDFVVALGVVPVGASANSWGSDDEGSTPWFDAAVEELGAEAPVRFNDADGIPVDDIAALEPDLVLSTYWDIPEKVYKKLSAFTDVVAYRETPFTATWQESLATIGDALGRSDAAAALEEDTTALLAEAGEEHPLLDGATFAYLGVSTTDTSTFDYLTPHDPRVGVLEEVGMELAPSIVELAGDSDKFFGTVSSERAADLESDVAIVMPYEEMTADELVARIEDDALLSRIPAVESGRWYPAADTQELLSLSAPSPLSLPWAVETIFPALEEATAE